MFGCCPPAEQRIIPGAGRTGNPGTNWIRQRGGGGVDPLVQIWNRARSSHQALGHHQVHSGGRDMWNISTEIYQIRLCSCFPCLLLFWRSRYMSGERHPNISFHFKSFVPSVRIREDFGLVIGRRLYKTRWRQLLLPCYPTTLLPCPQYFSAAQFAAQNYAALSRSDIPPVPRIPQPSIQPPFKISSPSPSLPSLLFILNFSFLPILLLCLPIPASHPRPSHQHTWHLRAGN